MKILILRGLPASGKSTWAREFLKSNPDWVRVNKDDIRAMFGCEWNKQVERVVNDLSHAAVRQAIWKGFNVIIDDTNLNPIHEKWVRRIAEHYGKQGKEIEVEVKIFADPLHICIERDRLREYPVGEGVITKMYEKWESCYPWLSL